MRRQVKVSVLCEELDNRLVRYGYSDDSMRRYRKVFRELQEFSDDSMYSQKVASDFLVTRLSDIGGFVTSGENSKNEMYYLRVTRSLADFYNFGTIFRRKEHKGSIVWPEEFRESVEGFLESKINYGNSRKYIWHCSTTIKDFILHLDANEIILLSDIKVIHVSSFIRTLVVFAPKTIRSRISALRNYKPFIGPFAELLEQMLQEKRMAGLKYIESGRQMHKLDELSCNYDCAKGLPKELVMDFTERKPNWHQSTQEHLIATTREVAAYLIRNGVPAYMIDKSRVTKRYENFKPYIFTHSQMDKIFSVADNIKARESVNSHIFYPTILRVQYGCGLRISETLNLKMKDIDLKENLLYVYDAKNHNDRIVPMHPTVSEVCKSYAAKIHSTYQSQDYFFQSRWGNGHYEKGSVNHYFREILFQCNLSHGGRRNGGPRLHDLRHTFCVHSLESMLKQGISHQVALPLLSTYLGHTSLSSMIRKVMAEKNIWSGAELGRLLQNLAGYKLSAPSISALINEQPKQVKTETMDALCMALECTASDLWVFTPTPYVKKKQEKVVPIKKVANGKMPPL